VTRLGLLLALLLAMLAILPGLAGCARCNPDNPKAADVLNPECYQAVNVPNSSYDDSIAGDAGIVLVETDGGCSTLPDAGACSLCAQAACCAALTACPDGTSCATLDECLRLNCASTCPEIDDTGDGGAR
jgi:hypothetical protein